MKTNLRKTLLFLLISGFAICCGVFMPTRNSATAAFAYESKCVDLKFCQEKRGAESGNGFNPVTGIEGIDYGENEVFDERENNNDESAEYIEPYTGTGCVGPGCGPGRENGYSTSYFTTGCRQWQQVPFYSPFYKYWIDESTLSGLTAAQKATFIANVDGAAALWNSTRMHDGTGVIVTFQKMPNDGVGVCSVRYDANLSDEGKFWPVAGFHYIKLRIYTLSTAAHEFGHMLGLQDLDMNGVFGNLTSVHSALMGYGYGSTELHYHDIQGLAVTNYKHYVHDFNRYVYDKGEYKHVCFYCDLIDIANSPKAGSIALINASTCVHDYQPMVSAGERHWLKCTACYKVVESEFKLKGVPGLSVTLEVTGYINGHKGAMTIPGSVGGQAVTRIAASAFANCTDLRYVTLPASLTTIGQNAFYGCTNLIIVNVGRASSSVITALGNNAFSFCPKLTYIFAPDSNSITAYKAAINWSSYQSLFKILSSFYGGGSGTQYNPFIISTAQQLDYIRYSPDKYFQLSNTINLSAYGQWQPVPYFYGTLDGNGRKITGLTINRAYVRSPEIDFGLFAINQGTIKDLTVTGVNIYFDPDHDPWEISVGAVCGANLSPGIISNVKVEGNIQVNRAYSYVGGIAGTNCATITDCYVGWVESTNSLIMGNGDLGGIAGNNLRSGMIINSAAAGLVIDHYYVYIDRSIGGIVGYNYNASIKNCYVDWLTVRNIGHCFTTNPQPYMGLIVGLLVSSTLVDVFAGACHFDPGYLNPNYPYYQTANFGAAGSPAWGNPNPWPWGGNQRGSNTVRVSSTKPYFV